MEENEGLRFLSIDSCEEEEDTHTEREREREREREKGERGREREIERERESERGLREGGRERDREDREKEEERDKEREGRRQKREGTDLLCWRNGKGADKWREKTKTSCGGQKMTHGTTKRLFKPKVHERYCRCFVCLSDKRNTWL
jgi:hypothetical protein